MLRAWLGRNRALNLARRTVAEVLGTAMLVAAVVGSGIMAERLSGGNAALALLANTIATGAALVALILTFSPISGAHLNPVVTLSFAFRSNFSGRDAFPYLAAQLIGAIAGVATANVMFGLPAISLSTHARAGAAQVFSECLATFGFVLVVRLCAKFQPRMIAFAVAAYIAAAYWSTSSTSFANPAVTIARSLSDTFTGIRPRDVPLFVLAEFVGAAIATLLASWLIPESSEVVIDD
jgi:glycerol uptake facilitator-like aquaporin